MNLSGTRAMVTGASRGIGRAVALELARRGSDIVLHYASHEDEARSVAREIETLGRKAQLVRADFIEAGAAERAAAEVLASGRIDILVSNAGGAVPSRAFESVEWADVERDLHIHLRAAHALSRALAPGMIAAGWGRIITIATIYTVGTPASHLLPYVTAKHALLGFTRALAVELAPRGVTVNAVSPGVTDTELIAHLPSFMKEKLAKESPAGRLGTPEDVAAAVAFLASREAGHLSGVNLPVAGGIE